MPPNPEDTIYALASGEARAGIAIVRISGPFAAEALRRLTRKILPQARSATYRTLFDITNGDVIDRALVLWFPGPGSYTGEDIVELHTHGGRAVLASVLGNLAAMPGFRLAEAGEFTRRAVENGKLDLVQAEAIADLVDAQTDAQRRQALKQFDGRLSVLYEDWRARLIRAGAWIEAAIDFPDEEIPDGALGQSHRAIEEIRAEIARHLEDGRRGEILREGLHVAVVGPPNAGKSSLVNALARRDVAIVSDIAGTTRDVIEVRLDVKGCVVVLADTAGLRESSDILEREGVRRAYGRAAEADIRLLVLDGGTASPEAGISPLLLERADIIVRNKADLVSERTSGELWVSTRTGEGIDPLIDRLAGFAIAGTDNEAPVLTRARHRQSLESARDSLDAALRTPADKPELTAESIRAALFAIGRITGKVDLEELLDVVFRDFCIGK